MIRTLLTVLAAAVVLLPPRGMANGHGGMLLNFSAPEVRMILQHGPWPAPWSGDPSNRVSGKPQAVGFGEMLFFDPRLSVKGTVSCANCHIPQRSWTDGRKRGVGFAEVDRNTPTLLNLRHQRWFGWDGANDNLWAQSVRPLLDAREMGMSERQVADLIRNDADLLCRYEKVFGTPPPAGDEALLIDIGKALAAFQETLVSGRTAFDEFRDALARGDKQTAARYPENAQRGLRIFVGKGSCNLCHFGPNFTHGEFHEVGIPVFKKSGGMDWGRYDGIKALRAGRLTLLGKYNDDPLRATGISTRHVALTSQNFEQFKVPTLRNIALTAPYMHNGHLTTLPEVVRHYSNVDPTQLHLAHLYDNEGLPLAVVTDTLLKPLRLSELEIADVVAFLQTLSDSKNTATRKPPVAAVCR
jgi:cytochrome c peroxidase